MWAFLFRYCVEMEKEKFVHPEKYTADTAAEPEADGTGSAESEEKETLSTGAPGKRNCRLTGLAAIV